jgi:hypothetical protein
MQTLLPKEEARPDCGGELHKFGEDVSEILERVPARLLCDPTGTGQTGLWELRQDRTSESAEPAHRTGHSRAGF